MKFPVNTWFVEIIWILSSIVLAYIVMLPIRIYHIDYPFTSINYFFIVGFCLFTRWLFLWKYTPYAWFKLLKLGLIFVFIPLIFIGINKFYDFRLYLDDIGIQELVTHLTLEEQNSLSLYIRNEMIFFGSAFIITAICIPFKMIRSLWMQYNRNKV